MSFGLRTWDAQGRLETDTTTFTYQVLLSTLIDFSGASDRATRTFNVAGFNPANCVAVLLPVNLAVSYDFDFRANNMPWIEVSTGQIRISPMHPNGADPNSSAYQKSQLIVRLMAMRYKQ